MSDGPTEGERWTRDELLVLRDRRWRPRALLRFLAHAQNRAGQTRRRRPRQARQAARWMLAGAAAWVAIGRLAPASSVGRAGRGGVAWWAGCALMLDWHLGMLETPDGRPVTLAAPDALTLLRAWLTPAVAHDASPVLLALGAASDLFDGLLARRTRTTRLGRDLEGLVDACFVMSALRSATATGRLSPVAAALEQARLLAGTIRIAVAYFATGAAPVRRRSSGRPVAPLRMAGLVAAGLGRRRLADTMVTSATVIAIVAFQPLAAWHERA